MIVISAAHVPGPLAAMVASMKTNGSGALHWMDLAATDSALAEDFYRELFGWHANEHRVNGGVFLHDLLHIVADVKDVFGAGAVAQRVELGTRSGLRIVRKRWQRRLFGKLGGTQAGVL